MDRKNSSLRFFRAVLFLLWTAFSTILYGIGCIVLSGVSRKMARNLGRLWTQHLLRIGAVKVTVRGTEKINRETRYVFISNHQSALDIPVLIAGLSHQLSFIAKKELFMIPFFGWGIAAMGHIWIDRSNARKAKASIDRAVNRLRKENISLLLFPEGTRSNDGRVGEFKQASFTLALKAGVQVVPVAIRNAANVLPKKALQIRPGEIFLDICDPIDVSKETTKAELCLAVHQIIKTRVEQI